MPAKAKKKVEKKKQDFSEYQTVAPMEQNLRKLFSEQVDSIQTSVEFGPDDLFSVGPVPMSEFDLKDLVGMVKGAKSKFGGKAFYLSEKPRVVGKETLHGMKIVAYVYGRWY